MGTAVVTAKSETLLEGLADARRRSDELFAILRPAALFERPIPERHRVIFYLGHLEAFDWNLLARRHFDLKPFAPALDDLFAFGIDPVGGGLPTDQSSDWPRLDEVADYKTRVRSLLDERVATLPVQSLDPSASSGQTAQLLHVAVEHRLMHVETLAYMLHQLPIGCKFPPHAAANPRVDLRAGAPERSNPRMVEIPAGTATLGLRRDQTAAFGWDNEFDAHSVSVPAFKISTHGVTNAEFLHFLNDGAYSQKSLWTEADWAWLQSLDESHRHPGFWLGRDGQWFCRTMFAEVPLPLDWPVYVSHAEASAYARWAGGELPSESEWHRSAYGEPGIAGTTGRKYPWGNESPNATRGNFDFERWDPTNVGAFPAGASAFGVLDLLGNGWEWTRTPFGPFPGFKPFSFYPGYSANFFDNCHFVMKGGSARTAACLLRPSFRNWFQPHYPFIYAGFRCVKH